MYILDLLDLHSRLDRDIAGHKIYFAGTKFRNMFNDRHCVAMRRR